MDSTNQINYADFVSKLAKNGNLILAELTGEDCNILHMAVGISGEAGELLDCIKKTAIYKKSFDRENAIEELGDLEFYMEGLRQAIKVSREEVLAFNIKKLSARYEKLSYSNDAAINRADKAKDKDKVAQS